MDRLTAFVAIAHMRLRLDYYQRNPHLLETDSPDMTPKLQGVLHSFSMLKHNLEADADKLAKRVETANDKRQNVFKASHETLDKVHKDMNDIETFLGSLEGSNAAPLDDSSEPSPEHLTVNGVVRDAGSD